MRIVPPLRRWVQAASLAFFCLLLCWAPEGGPLGLSAGSFLTLDPLSGVAVPLAARKVIAALWPVLLVYASAIVLGRVFCGWICPMGATLDGLGWLARVRGRWKPTPFRRPRLVKYLLLAAILLAAILGVNLAFWASPLPLTARLYALVLYPLGEHGMDKALTLFLPLMERWGSDALRYWQPDAHTYATAWVVAMFWGICIALEHLAPRFWCRYICPAGALLGLLALLAPWRRRVDGNVCLSCGRCAKSCPTGICHDMPAKTSVVECIACRRCERRCPQGAVRFGLRNAAPAMAASEPSLPSRRAFFGTLLSGTILGGLAGLATMTNTKDAAPVRPPGSVPEDMFLTLCLRCGACLRACPTGGLQPLWMEGNFHAIFSPRLDPRSGPCRPECTACCHVCPSRAILPLPLEEKRWAKMGTAVIDRTTCLAWNENKRCMVCNENCPYSAIAINLLPGQTVPVPQVQAKRCYGCGYCEKYCPQEPSAITVTSEGALRLATRDFAATAKTLGLDLDKAGNIAASHPAPASIPSEGPPPGFMK